MNIRKSDERGHANHGWLESFHTFSFADYYDPANMGFRSLRVINEDHIQGGTGFNTHGHRDMEIISYMVSGALEHKDTMGNSSVIRPGEVQYMSAGSGVRHSEFNHHSDREAHLIQIWILPNKVGTEPRYGQKSFAGELDSGQLVLVASPDGQNGSLAIQQDAKVYVARVQGPAEWNLEIGRARGVYLQVIQGDLSVKGKPFAPGDGCGIEDPGTLQLVTNGGAEFLVFDLA